MTFPGRWPALRFSPWCSVTDLQEMAPLAGRRTRTNTIMLGNMPAGRLNLIIGFGGKGRRSLCVVRYRDVAIYRRLEGVPVDEARYRLFIGYL